MDSLGTPCPRAAAPKHHTHRPPTASKRQAKPSPGEPLSSHPPDTRPVSCSKTPTKAAGQRASGPRGTTRPKQHAHACTHAAAAGWKHTARGWDHRSAIRAASQAVPGPPRISSLVWATRCALVALPPVASLQPFQSSLGHWWLRQQGTRATLLVCSSVRTAF